MNSVINNIFISLNNIGKVFWQYSASAFIQSSVLIILLLIIDFIIRKRVRAVFRYCVWMLVFVKLVLPPSFSLPTGIGYWWGDILPVKQTFSEAKYDMYVPESVNGPIVQQASELSTEPLLPLATSSPSLEAPVTSHESRVMYDKAVLNLPSVTWQAVVFVLWLVGVLVFSVLLIQRVFFVRGLIAQSSPAEGSLCEVLQQCRRQLGLRRDIQIRLSNNTSSPAVCGLFRPIILMPRTILDKMSPDNLKAVLVHELAHIKRGDLWVNLVQTILQVIYFYNPFVWLTNAIVRRIREQAVDEMVLVSLGAEAESYSNTLIDIAEMAFWRANFSLRLIGVAESKRALQGRIKHILTRPMPKSAKLGFLSLIVVFIFAAVLLPMAAAEDRGRKTDDRVEKQFIAALPNGVTVELVGLCEHPSEGKQWWRPDGIILSQAPYYTTGSQSTDEKDGYIYYEFALKLSHPDRMSYFWMIPGSGHGSDTGSPSDESGHQIQALKAYATNLPRKQKITTVCIGATAAEWQTIVKYKPEDLEENYSVGEFAIAFGTAYLKGNQTLLPVVHNYNLKKRQYAVRVIAITKSGQVRTSGYSGSGGNKLNSLTYIFNELPLETVKEFRFQTRPYRWVTFKNVSLQPGTKTDVQVEGGGQSGANQLPVAVTRSGQAKPELLKQIETVTDELIRAINSGDISTILSYYTDDAILLPDQHEAVIGKGALHKLYLEAVQEGAKIHSIKGLEQQIWDCGDFVFEAGRCVVSMRSPKLRYLLSDWRKSVTVWVRQPDGSLKIKLDSWNPDVIPDANVVSEAAEPVVTVVVGGSSSDSNMEAVYAQIKQKELTFHKAFIDRDAETAIKFYADDAVLMPWGTNMVKGRADILEHIKKGMNESPLVDINQHVVHIEGNDQMLFAVNLFSWTFKDKSSGENVTLPGKGVHVWKRQQDGFWKIVLDLHNLSVPIQQ